MLEGYGARVDLIGETFINKAGITSSTFTNVPDVPVTSFELVLPEGPRSALAANGNLCKQTLLMPVSFIAQDGAQLKEDAKVQVTGCAKAAKAAKARKARRARRARTGSGHGANSAQQGEGRAMRARVISPYRVAMTGLVTLGVGAFAAAPAGAHLARPATSFAPSGIELPVGVAVDQATGEVYIAGYESHNVERFSPSGEIETSFEPPELPSPWGVAVDNSGDSSKGDVYVAEPGSGVVLKLDPTGKEVAGFMPIKASSIPAGKVGAEGFDPYGVAVDPANGNVVVKEIDNDEVDIFSSSGVFISQFAGGSYGVAVGSGSEIFTSGPEGAQQWSPADGYSTANAIDPSDTLLDRSRSDQRATSSQTTPATSPNTKPPGAPLLQFGAGSSASQPAWPSTKRRTRCTPPASLEAGVYVFGAPAVFADVSTATPATSVTSTSASVSGSVNPAATTVSSCSFEYGLSTEYGATAPCSEPAPLTGGSPIAEAANLIELQPDATYHFRLAAANENGTSYGEDETFETPPAPPSLDSQSASAVRQTSAILNAIVNPNNQGTTYHFEFGATSAYGITLPIPDGEVGSGYGDVVVGQPLSGLTPGPPTTSAWSRRTRPAYRPAPIRPSRRSHRRRRSSPRGPRAESPPRGRRSRGP